MTGYPFPVEFIPKASQVFHGPKTRVYDCTKEFTSIGHSRISETEFLGYILNKYKEMVSNIEKVKFYKVFHKGDFCYFAVFWTSANGLFRDQLYDDGKLITEKTAGIRLSLARE